MSFKVVWTKRAYKQLLQIPKKQRLMILSWIEKNLVGCSNPKQIPGSKHIEGTQDGWRYRVGSYRLLAKINGDELLIEVMRVGHRQGVYNNLSKM